jgi:hypothetical protein
LTADCCWFLWLVPGWLASCKNADAKQKQIVSSDTHAHQGRKVSPCTERHVVNCVRCYGTNSALMRYTVKHSADGVCIVRVWWWWNYCSASAKRTPWGTVCVGTVSVPSLVLS